METHAHHLHKAPSHGWKHYFFEFFMLFLAVFCGFLAENQREHIVEHKRETQYIRSLVQDVKTDSLQIGQWLIQYRQLQKNCDTILNNFSEALPFPDYWARNFIAILHGYPDFIYTDQTMQQLKNAGGFRLIRSTSAIDSINAYDAAVRDILIEETVNDGYYVALTELPINSSITKK